MSISANYPALRPALLLDFANSQQLDPRITFSRSTTAPYYDGKTSVKAEENLFVYAQDFRAATGWSLTNLASTTQSAGIAPDGTNTLNLITEDSSSNIHNINKSITGIAGAYTVSFYLQANTRTYGCVKISTDGGTNNYSVLVNLTTGAFVSTQTTGSPTGTSYSIVASGSAFRISVTATNTSGTVGGYAALSNSSTPTFSGALPTYTGDGTSSIYAWGAQLEQRSSATAYNATTTSAITNYIPQLLTAPINAPRFDFNPTTGESLGLLIEQSSTNLLTYSQDFSNGNASWNSGSLSVRTINTIIAPDGTLTGNTITSVNATNGAYARQNYTYSATPYTASMYVKKGNWSYFGIRISGSISGGLIPFINLDTGVTNLNGIAGATMSAISEGNGWYRVSLTYTPTAGSSVTDFGMVDSSGSQATNLGAGQYVFVWGAQLEALAFSTSYISTTSSQVTRASDNASMTGNNFSSWYNQGQGAVYAENLKTTSGGSASFGVASISNGASANSINLYINPSVSLTDIDVINSGATQFTYYSGAYAKKQAISFANNNFAGSSGGTISTNSSGTVPSNVNQLIIGNVYTTSQSYQLNGWIKKISYYPQALTSTQLQALTGS